MKPLVFPEPIGLQDPLPDKAVVYLLRIPHEYGEVSVSIDGYSVGTLPPQTYTAIQVAAGKHQLVTTVLPTIGSSETGEPFTVTLESQQRRFFYVSKPRTSQSSLTIIPIAGVGAIPIFGTSSSPAGPWHWKEVTEVDAQGLLSISKPRAPLRDAF